MNDQHNSLPHASIRVRKENLHDDIRLLMKEIRPDWKPELIKFKESPKTVSHGVVNTMVVAYMTDPAENGIMCRIHGEGLHSIIMEGSELDYIQLIRKYYEFAPNVLLKFQNGFCYDYIDGEVLTHETVRLEPIWRIAAKQLAQVHSLPVPEKLRVPSKFYAWFFGLVDYPEKINDEKLNNRFQNEYPSKELYHKEHSEMTKMIQEMDSIPVVVHGDYKPGNMIWNKQTGKLMFVDYECSSFYSEVADIAYHFYMFAGIKKMDFTLFPSESFQREWLQVYLEEFYERTGRRKNAVTEQDVEALRVKTLKMYLMILLAVIGFCANNTAVNRAEHEKTDVLMEFYEIGAKSYEEYIRVKDDIMALVISEKKTNIK